MTDTWQAPAAGPDGAWLALLPLAPSRRAAADDPRPPDPLAIPAPAAIAPRLGRKPLRILVIEDNRDVADGLQLIFELRGHEALVAYSGIDGLETALRRLPDVILCDIGLPGMDGFAVARTLRAHPLTARARLIAVTGYSAERDRVASAAAGFEAHLVKPVEVEEILALVEAGPPPAGRD